MVFKPNHPEYDSHALFASLDRFSRFYERFSDLIMLHPTKYMNESIINVDTYLYMSIRGTLDSIRMTVHEGHVNDGYALVRKYYDLVILCLYVDQFLNDSKDEKADAICQVKNWLYGKEHLPRYGQMKDQLQSAKRLKPIIGMLLDTDDRYREIRIRSNDHMHFNNFHFIVLNDKDFYIDRKRSLDLMNSDVTDLFVLHLTCVFFTNERYMMASDYMDHLECGMTPDPDLLNEVDPFVQAIYDEVLKERQPEACAFIKDHTSMYLR